MKKLFLFQCEKCDKLFEDIVEDTIKDMVCTCGGTAVRIFGKASINFPCGGWKTGYSKPSTPIDADFGSGATACMPHYADRKTGKSLGFGEPTVIKDKTLS